MKRKHYILLSLLITVLLIFVGCKKTIEEKIGEKITEEILESSSGADVDIDDDITTIKTEQGTTLMGTNIPWPKDKMGDLKELKANITMFSEDEKNTVNYIMFDGLSEDDAQKYVESIKELGYKPVYEVTSSDSLVYIGKNENGYEVNFSFYEEGPGSLGLSKSEATDVEDVSNNPSLYTGDFEEKTDDNVSTSGDVDTTVELDMTDDVPWPADFLEGVPELEGKITGISSDGDLQKDIYVEYVKKEDALDFIEKIKKAGFTEEASESVSGDYIDYQAYNSNEDYIIIIWNSDNTSSISMSKFE